MTGRIGNSADLLTNWLFAGLEKPGKQRLNAFTLIELLVKEFAL